MIGDSIRAIRKQKHLSRFALSEKLGVAAETVARYERGDREPTISTLQQIAAVLDVSLIELLGGKCMPEPHTDKNEKDMQQQQTHTIRALEEALFLRSKRPRFFTLLTSSANYSDEEVLAMARVLELTDKEDPTETP